MNGSDAAAPGTSDKNGGYLPFTPTSGNIYTLSADLDTTGVSSYLWLGFARDEGGVSGTAPIDMRPDGRAWMYKTPTGGGNTYPEGSLDGGSDSWTTPTTGTLKIVLDTEDTAWTVEWFVGDSMK